MGYKRVKRLSSFRKIALSFWSSPKEGIIHGFSPVDASASLHYIDKIYAEHKQRVSIATMVGRGIAIAYRETPAFNSKIIWGTIYEKDTVDVFYHVDIGNGKDLAGVVVQDAANKSPLEIAKELEDKAKSLRRGKNKQYENTQKGILKKLPVSVVGFLMRLLIFLEYNIGLDLSFVGAEKDAFGTVMVTNVAPFRIHTAYPPLPSPTRVPAVGLVTSIQHEAIVIDGKVVIRPIFRLCGSFDHRLGDGAQIGRIQFRAKHYLENPELYEAAIAKGEDLPTLPKAWRDRPVHPEDGEYRDEEGNIRVREGHQDTKVDEQDSPEQEKLDSPEPEKIDSPEPEKLDSPES